LRKYGFGFITALLAANGLISEGGTSVVPASVKAGILIATMGLIVTLKLLDTHYRMFVKAASIRGRILEDRLNLDITNDISFLNNLEHWWRYVQALYYGFVILTVFLGFAILWSSALLLSMMLVAALASGMLIYFINVQPITTALEDWSVDRKIVSKGTPVRITYTNLNSGDTHKYPGTFKLSWKIKHYPAMAETAPVPGASPVEVQLSYFENYDWLWETEKVDTGLYELEMSSARTEKEGTLPRAYELLRTVGMGKQPAKLTIQVTPKEKEEPVRVVLEKTSDS